MPFLPITEYKKNYPSVYELMKLAHDQAILKASSRTQSESFGKQNIENIQLDSDKEGRKDDSGKTQRPELIPPEAIEALSTVLAFGAKKYADRNWEKGMDWGRVFGAAMRHLWAWWRREDKDPETGYSHLWHAFTCVAFLLTYEQRKIGKDTR